MPENDVPTPASDDPADEPSEKAPLPLSAYQILGAMPGFAGIPPQANR
ncbi:hypothetical protein [Planomonospora sp. ID82291]|nr:hypothetical protein [Planomonospora sp. ID82291]MBG0818956.1 hypothetical protein [Planomonospora sp. ID82291]